MKNYKLLLDEYEAQGLTIIHHRWGQSPTALYNQLIRAWGGKQLETQTIVVTSAKQYGLKTCLKFLEGKGIRCEAIGKGPNGLRVIECKKAPNKTLEAIKSNLKVDFTYRQKEYSAQVGEAIFSKTGLDRGTRLLLDALFEQTLGLNEKTVGDFGSGWGAISIVLSSEYPEAKIVAFDNDSASHEAAKENLIGNINAEAILEDLTNLENNTFKDLKGGLDLVISNPPFHSNHKTKQSILQNALNLLKPGGHIIFVTENSQAQKFIRASDRLFKLKEIKNDQTYTVFTSTKNK